MRKTTGGDFQSKGFSGTCAVQGDSIVRPSAFLSSKTMPGPGQRRDRRLRLTKDREGEGSRLHRELTGVRDLFQKNLVPITRLSQLEREATRLGCERGQLIAATAQAKGKIAELQLQIIQVDQDLSSEVAKEMREID